MPLQRVLEPEAMDTAEEAASYDAMDHSEVNQRFCAELIEATKPHFALTRVLDLGTGTSLIPIELCRQHADVSVVGADLAEHMLKVGRENVSSAGLADRIELVHNDAKSQHFAENEFPVVMSNSIVHHIPEPLSVLKEAARVASQAVYFRDLMRPDSDGEVERIVALYAGDESAHAKKLFDDSLRAALSIDEIRDLVAQVGFDAGSVQPTSDRHWTWFALKS